MSTSRRHTSPWILALVGLAAGVVGGGLGVGGGIVIVPLLLVVGFERHRAHATSLAAIVLIAAAGSASFAADGEIAVGAGITIGLGGVLGSIIGASVMHRMSARGLSIIFGVVLVIAAVRMMSGAEALPGSGDMSSLSAVALALGIGLVAGFFAGVAGVGGGVVIVPSAVFFLGLDQHQAQGTSLLAIVLTAVAGTVVNIRNRRVQVIDGLYVGVGGVAGAVIGSRIALAIDGRTLSIGFGVFILLVGVRTLYQAAVASQSADAG